jgi:hypothetical protein
MAVEDAALLQTSPIHTWVGRVAADKAPDSITIQVIIPELTPAAKGMVTTATKTQAVQLKDLMGNPINNTVTTGNTVTAYYVGGDSNRKYPPDVVKGEQVRITKYGNADKYYWESLGRDDALRQTETHRIEVANRKQFGDTTDDDHTYSIELDTKRAQHIRLKTSKGNGEAYAYLLVLDAAAGSIALSDDAGNTLSIESANARVTLRNTKGAFAMLNDLDVIIGSPRDLTIKAQRQIFIDSPLITIRAEEGTGVLALIANAIALTAHSATTTTAPSIGLTGAVQVPTILTANEIRAAVYSNGDVGTTYTPATIALDTGTGVAPAVSPDTYVNPTQRHSVSWEQITSAMAIVTNCFNQIQNSINVPNLQPGIAPLIVQSKMGNLQGT